MILILVNKRKLRRPKVVRSSLTMLVLHTRRRADINAGPQYLFCLLYLTLSFYPMSFFVFHVTLSLIVAGCYIPCKAATGPSSIFDTAPGRSRQLTNSTTPTISATYTKINKTSSYPPTSEISNTPSSPQSSEFNNTASSPPTSEMNKASRSPQTSDTNKTIPYVLGAVSISVFVIIVTAFIVLLRCRRQKPPKPFPLTDMQFEYDAFVIYSSEDSDWVVRTLIPTLEEKHGLKCCVHYRDFLIGVPFRQNMADSVYKSRKTIAVVSTHFFSSNYCGTELDYALYRLMEKKDDSLIVIKLDDVDSRKLPRELQKRSYIDYLKSTDKETWEKKLVKCLTSTRYLPEQNTNDRSDAWNAEELWREGRYCSV